MVSVVAAGIWASASGAEEGWPGIGGVGRRHSSAVEVAPGRLEMVWRRDFERVTTVGGAEGPQNEMRFSTSLGSRNLVLRGGDVFLLAADGDGFPEGFYGTVLDAADGSTRNCIRLEAGLGNTRIYNWPHHAVGMSYDNPTGQPVTWWDPESGILFTGQTGYDAAFTAYLPQANLEGHRAGGFQPGVPAYLELESRFPGFEDPYGRKREQLVVRQGVGKARPDLRSASWGPALLFAGGDAGREDARVDLDFKASGQVEGLTFYNLSGAITGDPAGPALAVGSGYGVGHNQAGWAMIFNKFTGLKALGGPLDFPPVAEPPYRKPPPRLAPFVHGGTILLEGRAYFAGPGDDVDGNGRFGDQRILPNLSRNDQGLHLWAVELVADDRRPNGGHEGAGAAETMRGGLLFRHRLPSRFPPNAIDLEDRAQSYYEGDGLYRPKAMLVEGGGIWFAWKPSRAEGVELIRADESGVRTFDLQAGRGMLGVELWPKLALTQGAEPRLVYFTGLGATRKPYLPVDPRPQLMRNRSAGGPAFGELPRERQERLIAAAKKDGFWSEELHQPSGPAELVVFDPVGGRVVRVDDVSERARNHGFPVNDFFTALDASHLVVAGRWAYVGWVDVGGDEASLRLLAYDTLDAGAPPVMSAFPLGFRGPEFPRSILSDLVAADGRLHALVTKSKVLEARDPRWSAQQVVTLAMVPEPDR